MCTLWYITILFPPYLCNIPSPAFTFNPQISSWFICSPWWVYIPISHCFFNLHFLSRIFFVCCQNQVKPSPIIPHTEHEFSAISTDIGTSNMYIYVFYKCLQLLDHYIFTYSSLRIFTYTLVKWETQKEKLSYFFDCCFSS